jgi:hypothetical protein
MGCLKLTYYEQGNALEVHSSIQRAKGLNALEVNSNFFGEALEKKGYSDFFRLKAYTYGFNGFWEQQIRRMLQTMRICLLNIL